MATPIPLRSLCMYPVPRDDGKPGTILGCRTRDLILTDTRNGLVQCRACGHWSTPPKHNQTIRGET